jgi:transposase
VLDWKRPDGARNGTAADNEVRPRNRQKRYTTAYKLRIIEEADRCSAPGELASLIRREGIYSSTIADFRRQKARGELDGAARGSGKTVSPQQAELEKRLAAVERENRKLKRDLEQSRALIELQKKVAEILGATIQGDD